MNKHTPGPWIWANGFKGLYGAGKDNEVLDHAEYEGMWLGPNAKANASLIAAAPDLLEACKEAIKELEDCLSAPSYDWDFYEKLRRAIAKAEGR